MRLLLPLLSVLAGLQAYCADVVNVSDYGAVPNSFEDATVFVNKAITACKNKNGATLYFRKGRYDFWPAQAAKKVYYITNTSSQEECPSKIKTIGLLFEKLNGLTIEGNGSLFVFHGKMITWAFDHCQNMKLQHVSIDFERPTMSEMTFNTVTKDSIIVTIHPDSRFTIINNHLLWYGEGWTLKQFHAINVNPQTGETRYSDWQPFNKSHAEVIAPFMVKFTGDFSSTNFHPGEVLTIRDPVRDEVGAFINQSKNISLQQVNMQYMHGLGIVAQFSENLFYDSVNIMPATGSGRMIASSADGMHFSGCKGDIKIENCRFKGFHDDPVNVHGTHLQVQKVVSASSVIVRFMHPQTYGMQAFFKADSVAFVESNTLRQYFYSVVTGARLISEKEMLLQFNTAIPATVKAGDCLENITCTPTLTVSNCRFEFTNTRGLLVTTRRKVLIENNVFFRTGMYAILIGDDAQSWYESGPVQDVTIRNNRFEECAYNLSPDNYVIAIAPENHQLVKGLMVHSNIRIEHNIFKVYDDLLLTAKSTKGLTFSNNSIVTSSFMPAQPKAKAAFRLTACAGVEIKNNHCDAEQKLSVELISMDKGELNTDL